MIDLQLSNEPGSGEPCPAGIIEQAVAMGYEGDDLDQAEEYLRCLADDRAYHQLEV